MFDKIFNEASEKCAGLNGSDESDYVKDGLIYCGKCHTPKQCKVPFTGETILNCVCDCADEEYERRRNQIREQQKSDAIYRLRKSGIHNTNMHKWTFENDNGSSPALIQKAKRFVNGWEEMKSKGVGLCFFGNVGTGKTYAAACIANALIDNGVRVIMTDFSRIINDMQSFDTRNKNAYIDDICGCDLLIIDDLGAERQSDYALQICEQVIDERAKSKKPLVLTTNISLEAIENPPDTKYARMYSRILENIVAVQSTGKDKRIQTHEDNMKWARAYFSD